VSSAMQSGHVRGARHDVRWQIGAPVLPRLREGVVTGASASPRRRRRLEARAQRALNADSRLPARAGWRLGVQHHQFDIREGLPFEAGVELACAPPPKGARSLRS